MYKKDCSEVEVEGADSAYLLRVDLPKFKQRYYYCILLIDKNVFCYEIDHNLDSSKEPDDVVDEKTICKLAAVSVKGKQKLSAISSEPFVPAYENVNPGIEPYICYEDMGHYVVYDSETIRYYQELLEENGCKIVSDNKDIFNGKVTYKKGNLKFDMILQGARDNILSIIKKE